MTGGQWWTCRLLFFLRSRNGRIVSNMRWTGCWGEEWPWSTSPRSESSSPSPSPWWREYAFRPHSWSDASSPPCTSSSAVQGSRWLTSSRKFWRNDGESPGESIQMKLARTSPFRTGQLWQTLLQCNGRREIISDWNKTKLMVLLWK